MHPARRLAVSLFRPRPPRGPLDSAALERVRRLIVIRAHDQLGDFLLVTPAMQALRRRFRDARITLVVNRFLSPLARNNPDVDRLVVVPWKRSPRSLSQLLGAHRLLRAETYDLAVVLNTVSHSLTSDLLARWSGASCVAGPEKPSLKDFAGAPFYDWILDPTGPSDPHQMSRALAIVAPLGCSPESSGYRYASTAEERTTAQVLRRTLPGGRLVALHIGTRDPEKRYSQKNWLSVAKKIALDTGAHLVLFDAPDARDESRSLAERLQAAHTTLAPLTLRQAAALLEHMDVLVCHDSAFLHLAAAVRTATVSIHGRGRVEEWKPPGERHVALQADDSLPDHIDPARVADSVRNLLQPARREHA